ncbi:MAG: cation diffusion facilitator family transporter [Eubacteriales bacterium]|nr:cation diffusion facilitator family transporter [Eubacteriales bacterium]
MDNTKVTPSSIENQVKSRDRIIVRTSIIGIVANILLAAFKAVIGILSHSIAVTLDAVNNLSDALSSVITIIGARLANRKPDKKHPLGHGRTEYLSAMIVAAIVLYAGLTSAYESVKKIISPETPDYSTISLVIIAVAVVVKILLGRYFIRRGKEAGSGALEASGADASFDAVLSLSVLACAILFKVTGISLEAVVGAVISIFIIKSGVEMMLATIDDIVGKRADAETVRRIKELITQEPEVRGAYDLFINNYGPERDFASVHVELPDTMDVEQVDLLTRRLEQKVYQETGVILTGIGVYSYNTRNEEAAQIRSRVMETALKHEWLLQIHGFHIDTEKKVMRFDAVFSFDIDSSEGYEIIYKEVKALYPEYELQITRDVDVS